MAKSQESSSLSHAERMKRREAIVAAVRRGEARPAVAHRFGVSVATVDKACREFAVSRDEELEGRLRLGLEAVRGGASIRSAALRHSIPFSTLRDLVHATDLPGQFARCHATLQSIRALLQEEEDEPRAKPQAASSACGFANEVEDLRRRLRAITELVDAALGPRRALKEGGSESAHPGSAAGKKPKNRRRKKIGN